MIVGGHSTPSTNRNSCSSRCAFFAQIKQIDLASGMWCAATDLLSWGIFFPHAYQKGGAETVGIHLEWTTRHIYSLVPAHSKPPVLCLHIGQRNLGHLSVRTYH